MNVESDSDTDKIRKFHIIGSWFMIVCDQRKCVSDQIWDLISSGDLAEQNLAVPELAYIRGWVVCGGGGAEEGGGGGGRQMLTNNAVKVFGREKRMEVQWETFLIWLKWDAIGSALHCGGNSLIGCYKQVSTSQTRANPPLVICKLDARTALWGEFQKRPFFITYFVSSDISSYVMVPYYTVRKKTPCTSCWSAGHFLWQ